MVLRFTYGYFIVQDALALEIYCWSYLKLSWDFLQWRLLLLFLHIDVVALFEEAWGQIKGDCPYYFRWSDQLRAHPGRVSSKERYGDLIISDLDKAWVDIKLLDKSYLTLVHALSSAAFFLAQICHEHVRLKIKTPR